MLRHPLGKALTLWLCLALATAAVAGKHHSKSPSSSADNTPGAFDYYLLVLSWAPEFCATHQSSMTSSECDPNRHYGFVVHGLWPQNNDGSWPKNCGGAQPVSNEIVREMLPIMPARGLIQHEWATHGTCSGLASQQYFAEIQQLFKSIRVPQEYQHPGAQFSAAPSDIEQKFAQANGAPQSAFRVSCSAGDFIAIEACFDKNLKYQDCGSSVKQCRAPQVKVLPTP